MMTSRLNNLSLRYLEKHPEDAARNIERFNAEEQLALFVDLLPQLASQIIVRLNSFSAVNILAQLELKSSIEILDLIPVNSAASLLRRMPAQQRKEVLTYSKEENRLKNLRVMLKYSERSVGSIMNPRIHVFHKSMSGDDVRHILSSDTQNSRQQFYIVDENNVLSGFILATDVLIRDSTVKLEEIMRPCTAIINIRTSVENAVNNSAWDNYNYLPVVDSERTLQGEIEKNTLYRTAQELSGNTSASDSPGEILLGLTETFLNSFSELLSDDRQNKSG